MDNSNGVDKVFKRRVRLCRNTVVSPPRHHHHRDVYHLHNCNVTVNYYNTGTRNNGRRHDGECECAQVLSSSSSSNSAAAITQQNANRSLVLRCWDVISFKKFRTATNSNIETLTPAVRGGGGGDGDDERAVKLEKIVDIDNDVIMRKKDPASAVEHSRTQDDDDKHHSRLDDSGCDLAVVFLYFSMFVMVVILCWLLRDAKPWNWTLTPGV